MAEIPLTVDLTQLRTVANRVDRAADAIGRFRFAGLRDEDLAGSAVAGIASPALGTARLDDLVARMRGWAMTARLSAGAFETAEQNSVARIDGS